MNEPKTSIFINIILLLYFLFIAGMFIASNPFANDYISSSFIFKASFINTILRKLHRNVLFMNSGYYLIDVMNLFTSCLYFIRETF